MTTKERPGRGGDGRGVGRPAPIRASVRGVARRVLAHAAAWLLVVVLVLATGPVPAALSRHQPPRDAHGASHANGTGQRGERDGKGQKRRGTATGTKRGARSAKKATSTKRAKQAKKGKRAKQAKQAKKAKARGTRGAKRPAQQGKRDKSDRAAARARGQRHERSRERRAADRAAVEAPRPTDPVAEDLTPVEGDAVAAARRDRMLMPEGEAAADPAATHPLQTPQPRLADEQPPAQKEERSAAPGPERGRNRDGAEADSGSARDGAPSAETPSSSSASGRRGKRQRKQQNPRPALARATEAAPTGVLNDIADSEPREASGRGTAPAQASAAQTGRDDASELRERARATTAADDARKSTVEPEIGILPDPADDTARGASAPEGERIPTGEERGQDRGANGPEDVAVASAREDFAPGPVLGAAEAASTTRDHDAEGMSQQRQAEPEQAVEAMRTRELPAESMRTDGEEATPTAIPVTAPRLTPTPYVSPILIEPAGDAIAPAPASRPRPAPMPAPPAVASAPVVATATPASPAAREAETAALAPMSQPLPAPLADEEAAGLVPAATPAPAPSVERESESSMADRDVMELSLPGAPVATLPTPSSLSAPPRGAPRDVGDADAAESEPGGIEHAPPPVGTPAIPAAVLDPEGTPPPPPVGTAPPSAIAGEPGEQGDADADPAGALPTNSGLAVLPSPPAPATAAPSLPTGDAPSIVVGTPTLPPAAETVTPIPTPDLLLPSVDAGADDGAMVGTPVALLDPPFAATPAPSPSSGPEPTIVPSPSAMESVATPAATASADPSPAHPAPPAATPVSAATSAPDVRIAPTSAPLPTLVPTATPSPPAAIPPGPGPATPVPGTTPTVAVGIAPGEPEAALAPRAATARPTPLPAAPPVAPKHRDAMRTGAEIAAVAVATAADTTDTEPTIMGLEQEQTAAPPSPVAEATATSTAESEPASPAQIELAPAAAVPDATPALEGFPPGTSVPEAAELAPELPATGEAAPPVDLAPEDGEPAGATPEAVAAIPEAGPIASPEPSPNATVSPPGPEAIAVAALTVDQEVRPGEPSQYRFQVTNTASAPVTVRPSAGNSLPGWRGEIVQREGPAWQGDELTLGPGQRVVVIVEVTTPGNARVGDRNTISLDLVPIEEAAAPIEPPRVGPIREPNLEGVDAA